MKISSVLIVHRHLNNEKGVIGVNEIPNLTRKVLSVLIQTSNFIKGRCYWCQYNILVNKEGVIGIQIQIQMPSFIRRCDWY